MSAPSRPTANVFRKYRWEYVPNWGWKIKKNGRRPLLPDKDPFRYQERPTLALRNHIRGTGGRDTDVVCIQEMQSVLSCFKQFDFDEEKCQPQITAFNKCYEGWRTERVKKDATDKFEPIPYQVSQTPQRINTLLARYPHPKKEKK